MPGIWEELLIFLNAVVTGGILRLFYQSVNCLRKIRKHPRWLIGAEDFIFWIITAIYTFVQIYQTSSGVIRWYFILGIVVGALFSSKNIKKIESKIEKNSDFNKGKTVAKQNKKRYYNNIKGEKSGIPGKRVSNKYE